MSISSKVEKCLAEQGINYQVVNSEDLMPMHELKSISSVSGEAVAISVMLNDSLGRLQVLLPKDTFLNLSELCEQLGRNLQALSPEEQERLASEQGAETLPAIPSLYNLPIVVDATLMESEKIYLDSGHEGFYVELSHDEFKKALGQADVGNFCIPIAQLKDSIQKDDRAEIESAVQQFTTLRIKQRLDQTLEMPPLPDSAERIIQLRLDPEAGVGELAEIVEKDPSLAAQVVSWASSPYYAAPGTIRSVHDAVVRVLGFDLVINLALGLALGKSLEVPKDGVYGVNPYWQESVYTAAMAEALVKAISADHRPSLGLTYLSGLLHNYGYLVLAHVFPPHYELVNRYIEANPHINHSYLERHLIGVCREQIGALLMESWGMPEEVVKGIRWSHTLDYEDENCEYSRILYVATNMLKSQGLYQGDPEPIPAQAFASLSLDPVDAEAALEKIVESKDDLINMARNLGG
ncbi:MAG: HDOD domain-containing protein [Pseudomonadales bacterium]|nr:HDOD domain-containing protein [Pseudomonadales bacterium]